MQRSWTVEAATSALVNLRPLIALLRAQRSALDQMKEELLRLRRLERTGALPGGTDQNQLQFTDAHASLHDALTTSSMVELRIKAVVDQMQASVDRVSIRGVELRDIERGLIDFPALADGRPFFLCWQELDGDEVSFAHAFGEGFGARLPLAAYLHRHIHER
ncbi:MAG: hypothetical protein RIT06_312 [Chloroflexota bacterium]